MPEGTTAFEDAGSFAAILLLILVHLFVHLLDRLGKTLRDMLLSAGAGISLAYVMLRLLPKLASKQAAFLASAETGFQGFLEHHAYLAAMIGLISYYGVSRIAVHASVRSAVDTPIRYQFALASTALAYCAYSTLIAYLIVKRGQLDLFSIVLIFLGMGTLFMVSGYGLRKQWRDAYDSWIRWALSASLILGWLIGINLDVSDNVVALWFAMLAGVMLFTTIREKLSIEGPGTFISFILGVSVFAVLALAFEHWQFLLL